MLTQKNGVEVMLEPIVGRLMERHDRGLYGIACDKEASEHYGIGQQGVSTKLWLIRCYLAGFFAIKTA